MPRLFVLCQIGNIPDRLTHGKRTNCTNLARYVAICDLKTLSPNFKMETYQSEMHIFQLNIQKTDPRPPTNGITQICRTTEKPTHHNQPGNHTPGKYAQRKKYPGREGWKQAYDTATPENIWGENYSLAGNDSRKDTIPPTNSIFWIKMG